MAIPDSTDSYVEIQLTRGVTALVDAIDADLAALKWRSTNGYATRTTSRPNRTTQYMHRVILERMLGRPLKEGEEVDHINLNRFDNRRANLRIASRGDNQHNKPRYQTNKSGYKGVSFDAKKKKWQAAITVKTQKVWLGYFDTPEEAHEAYRAAAKELHGDFSRS